MIVAEYLCDHLWDHIRDVNEVMKARKDAVVESLATHFGDLGEEVWWTDPPGGMFVWVRIPSATDTRKALQLAAGRGVYLQPGSVLQRRERGHPVPAHRIRVPHDRGHPRRRAHPLRMHQGSPGQGPGGVNITALLFTGYPQIPLDPSESGVDVVETMVHISHRGTDFCEVGPNLIPESLIFPIQVSKRCR